MRARRLFILLTLGLGLTLALLWLLGGNTPSAHADSPHYVAPGGICGGVTPCHATIQEAVDAAVPGDEIRAASGTYTGVNNYGGLAQVVYISKTVTVRGGYTTTNWTTPYPITQPTTLDAQGQGRVLYITGDISPTIEGLHITDGNAAGLGGSPWGDDAGGGVYVITATATINNNRVFNNTAGEGGGLYVIYSDARLGGNTVYVNTAYWGGGLLLEMSDARLSRNTVISNTAIEWGGGLLLELSDATLSGNTFAFNTAHVVGGGLCLIGSSDAILSGNIVVSNTASDAGGGLFLDGSDATLSGNTVISNTAYWDGGGLFLQDSDATLINNVIADNRANVVGGGLYIIDSSPHFLYTTIARNSDGDDIGVYGTGWFEHSTIAMTNTILVSHTLGIMVTAGNTATLEATLWGDGAWANDTDWGGTGTIITGTHNYWGAPDFADPDAGDYHIGLASAAIDEGVDVGVNDDIDGDPRPQGSGYDIGADELVGTAPSEYKIYLPLIMRQHP